MLLLISLGCRPGHRNILGSWGDPIMRPRLSASALQEMSLWRGICHFLSQVGWNLLDWVLLQSVLCCVRHRPTVGKTRWERSPVDRTGRSCQVRPPPTRASERWRGRSAESSEQLMAVDNGSSHSRVQLLFLATPKDKQWINYTLVRLIATEHIPQNPAL